MSPSTPTKADYGIDAPPVVRNLTLVGVIAIAIGILTKPLLASVQPLIATILTNC